MWRIRIIGGSIVLFALIFLARAFQLQVIQAETYKNRAESQNLGQAETLYDRGTIFFRKKDGVLVSAATLRPAYTLLIVPDKLKNPESAYRLLSQHIELDRDNFLFRAGQRDGKYKEIRSSIDSESAEKIKSLALTGIELRAGRERYYPGEDLASHVLGFVGHNEEGYSGRYGLENYYEDSLSREDSPVYRNFFVEMFSDLGTVLLADKSERKGDIVLTIEPIVQAFVESELDDLDETYHSASGGAVIIDPATGEVLAMAAVPDFHPGNYKEEKDINVFGNPLVSNVYEFGSIVKPLTMAAGLDAGKVSENDTYNDKGSVVVGDARIHNFDFKARGVVPMQEILNQSLNTGAVHVMQQMGRGLFREYIENYGLGDITQIDLPGEVSGNIVNLYEERDVEFATASFGQGVAFTPMEMTRALATLANGGILVRPHLVAEFRYESLPSKRAKTEEQSKVLKQSTSRRISEMLTTVVDEALLGGKVALPRYSIAAKTGTAQIPAPEGGYYDDQYLHSFFGYFPAYEPRFLVFLYIVKPEGKRYASETLTEPFMDIAEFLLNYYEVPPDR